VGVSKVPEVEWVVRAIGKAGIVYVCLRRPSASAEKNAMLKPGHIDIVNTQIGPVECRLNCLQRLRLIHFVNLRHIKHGLRAVDLLKIMNNLQNRWLGTVEAQASVRLKRVAPWRTEENDDEIIGGCLREPTKSL
jgi:hypothetical protein